MPETFSEADFAQPMFSEADFAGPPKPKRTREQVMASIGPSSESEVPLMTRIGSAMYEPIELIRRMEPINAVKEAMMGLTELGRGNFRQAFYGSSPEVQQRFNMPVVSPETAQKAVEFFSPGGRAPEGTPALGVQQFLADLASGLTTFEGMGGLASGRISPRLPQVQFGGGMIQDVPQAITALQQAQGGVETTKNALRLGLDVLGPLGIARADVSKAPTPSGLTAVDIPSSLADIPLTREMSQEYLNMVENQRRAAQGYSVLPRREAQQPPVIIGEQPQPRQVFYVQPQAPIEPGLGPTVSPVEPSGGEISFRSPAAGYAIPSALQSKLTEGEQNASTIRSTQETVPQTRNVGENGGETRGQNLQRVPNEVGGEGLRGPELRQEARGLEKPTIAKIGTSTIKNNYGDPIGTQYFGTSEDVSAYDKVQSDIKAARSQGLGLESPEIQSLMKQNEALKNKYGGMPPKSGEGPTPITVSPMYGGLPFDPTTVGKDIADLRADAIKAKNKFKNWVDKAASEPRPLGWSPYWNASPKERAQALLGPGEHRSIEKFMPEKPQPGEPAKAFQGLQNALNKAVSVAGKGDKLTMPKDVIFDYLDKGKATYDGPLFQHIVWPVDDNFQTELTLRDKYIDPIVQLKKTLKLSPESGERVGVFLNTLQDGGTERMIASGIKPEIINKIVSTITPAERKVAGAMRAKLDETFPLVANLAKRLYGKDITPIDNYFSWQRDWAKYDQETPKDLAEPKIDTGTIEWLKDSYPTKGTKTAQGYTVTRMPNAQTPIQIDAFKVYDRHMRDVAHFLAMQEHLKTVGEIVRNPKFAEKYGNQGQAYVIDWLNNVARQGAYENKIQWMDAMRKRVGVGILAYRLGSQFVHMANVPLAIERTGPVWWSRGLNEALGDKGQQFLQKNFGETFERGGGEPSLYEIQTSPLTKRNVAGRAYEKVKQGGFVIQRAIDQLNAQATTLGIYMRMLSEKGLDPNKYDTLPIDKEALAQARVLSRRAVASPLYKDVPLVLTRGSVERLFFQFQNTFLDQWSNIRYDLPEYIRNNPKKAATLTAALASMLLVETGVKFGVKQGLQAAAGYEPKDEDSFGKLLAHEGLRRVPGMGQLMTQVTYGGTGVPAVDVTREAVRNATEAVAGEDTKMRKLSAIKAGTAIGELLGVPGTSQASQFLQDKLKAKYFKTHEQQVKDIAQQKFGKKEGLTLEQRMEAEQAYKEAKPPMTRDESTSSGLAAIKNIAERGKGIEKQLDKDEKAWLNANKLRIPGHADTITLEGTRMVLSKAEMVKYEALLLSKYKERLADFRKYPGFEKMPQDEKIKEFNNEMTQAAREAREEMLYNLEPRK